MALLLQYTLIYASVLMLVALGGCYSEHGGVINLGLEGTMVMGALGGALVMRSFPNLPGIAMLLAVVIGAVLFGVIYSLLLAVAAINFGADQTLVGTAMNLLGTAGATVFVKALNMSGNSNNVSSSIQYIEQKKAFALFKIGTFEVSWFMVLAVLILIAAHVVLYKTKFGLRLMACGARWAASAVSSTSRQASVSGSSRTASPASASWPSRS